MMVRSSNYRRKPVGNARRTYQRKRPVPKKKGGKINWGSVAKTAVDTAATVGKIISMLNVEKHFVSLTGTMTPLSASPQILLINGLIRGDTSSTRQGDQIKMTNLNIRGRLSINNTSTDGNTQTRVMVVVDKQANGSTMALTDLLENTQTWSFRALGYRKRFQVLYDKTHQLVLNSSTEQKVIDFGRIMDMRTYYQPGSNLGTIVDIATNALYLIVMTDEAVNGPSLDYSIRLRWVDN